MVDRIARDKFAELLRHFTAGNLTNDEYEDAAHLIIKHADRQDRSLRAVFSRAWFLYSDTREYRLRGKDELTEEGRHAVARWILFLHSDFEYEWPVKSFISLSGCLLRVCTLGLAEFILGRANERRLRQMGTWDLWPFFRDADFQSAKARPRLLGGKGRASDFSEANP